MVNNETFSITIINYIHKIQEYINDDNIKYILQSFLYNKNK
jgi:hypothetical protein